jgi:hypothetical protein
MHIQSIHDVKVEITYFIILFMELSEISCLLTPEDGSIHTTLNHYSHQLAKYMQTSYSYH